MDGWILEDTDELIIMKIGVMWLNVVAEK